MLARQAEDDKKREARILDAGVGVELPPHSIFRRAIEDDNIDSRVIYAIKQGFLCPNGARLWSAYFSKIDWENDGHLFERILLKKWGESGVEGFIKLHGDNLVESIFRFLSYQDIDYINTYSGPLTILVNIGLSDSRDYTPFDFACARVYGVDPHETAMRCDTDYAKENFETMIHAIYDASIFVNESSFNQRSTCPGIEYSPEKKIIKESAMCAIYLSRFFTDRQWAEICQSNIWLLVKDIVAVLKSSRPVAA
jgi:hypothetical protein